MGSYAEANAGDWLVEIVNFEDGTVVQTHNAGPLERRAEKLESGINISLNHAQFYTRTRQVT